MNLNKELITSIIVTSILTLIISEWLIVWLKDKMYFRNLKKEYNKKQLEEMFYNLNILIDDQIELRRDVEELKEQVKNEKKQNRERTKKVK